MPASRPNRKRDFRAALGTVAVLMALVYKSRDKAFHNQIPAKAPNEKPNSHAPPLTPAPAWHTRRFLSVLSVAFLLFTATSRADDTHNTASRATRELQPQRYGGHFAQRMLTSIHRFR